MGKRGGRKRREKLAGFVRGGGMHEGYDYEGWEGEGYHWARERQQGNLPTLPKEPPLTAEQVAAALAAVSEIRVGVPESLEELTKLQTYVVAENGTFLLRRGPVGIVCVEVPPDKFPGMKGKLQKGLALTVPKIPGPLVQQILSFFRKVSEKTSNEAYVQVWFEHPHEAEGQQVEGGWWIEVPEQTVGGASVNHRGHSLPTATRIHVADIHSHGKHMSAFFSGTDDGDERTQGQRIFGVIGKVIDPLPEFKWRVGIGDGKFLDLPMSEVVDTPPVTVTISPTAPMQHLQALIAGEALRLWAGNVEFPEAWLEQVKMTSYSSADVRDYKVTDRRSLPPGGYSRDAHTPNGRPDGALFWSEEYGCWKDAHGNLRRDIPTLGGPAPGTVLRDHRRAHSGVEEVAGVIHAGPGGTYVVERQGKIIEVD